MAELKEFEVIMRCTPVAGMNGKGEIVIQAEKVSELVRCKDCKHSRTNKDDDEDVYYCERTIGRAFHSGDFCSGGERRDNGEIHI